MFAIFKSPHPCSFGQKQNVSISIAIGVFVTLFLLIFKPFGISDSRSQYLVPIMIGYGIISFASLLFYYFIIPKIFKDYYKEKNYTLGKEIVSLTLLVTFIGLANGIYSQIFIAEDGMPSPFAMMGQTFLIGVFPLTFLSLFQYNRLLQSNLKTSQDITLPKAGKQRALINKETQYYTILTEKETVKIALDDLLYLESEGNYAIVNTNLDGEQIKTMYRMTLKSIQSENTYQNIIRCHRSFIVNLDQVIAVNGNAQGLRLSLNNCKDIVPVSRKYISEIKAYLNQQ